MKLKPRDAYLVVCDRSLAAAKASSDAAIHENTCFLSYHAFESLGGAMAASRAAAYSKSHQKKITQFVQLSKTTPHRYAVAKLAIALASLRNLSLYPLEQPDGSARVPSDAISSTAARQLMKRVQGLATVLRRIM